MDDLKLLRQGWDEVEAFETEILRKQTIQEKVSDYLQLLSEFGKWKNEIERSYQKERDQALIELQRRLQRLERCHNGA